MKKHKKLLIIGAVCGVLALAVIAALPMFGLSVACAVNYTDVEQADDGFDYLIREKNKKAAVCTYAYDPMSDHNIIDIPETYGDYPVKGLGGYVGKGAPCPFYIGLKGISAETNVGLSEGSFDWYTEGKDIEIVYYDLTLNIGANIREIFAEQSGLLAGDKLYVARVYANCDPDNPAFYSKDGILYQKNGKVVEGFLYWDKNY